MKRQKSICVKIIIVISILIHTSAIATPYQPKNDFIVLNVEKTDLVKIARNKIGNEPESEALLLKTSYKLLQKAKQENNNALFGQIESILMQQRELVMKNNQLKIRYADVLQHRHAFAEAKYYLKGINSPEANLLRSTIYQNLGEYANASQECKKIIGQVNIVLASTCLFHAESYRGKLYKSHKALEKINKQFNEEKNDYQLWMLTALADMANRLGLMQKSINYYKKANSLKPDNHIVSEYVDVLFSHNMQKEVVTLLGANHFDLRLKLRYLRSRKELNKISHVDDLDELKDLKLAVELIELRKDKRHYDTRAEYYIWIEVNPEKAVHWANENWKVSKTPNSAKLLLLASELKHDAQGLISVREWITKNKIEDYSLDQLVTKLSEHEVVT